MESHITRVTNYKLREDLKKMDTRIETLKKTAKALINEGTDESIEKYLSTMDAISRLQLKRQTCIDRINLKANTSTAKVKSGMEDIFLQRNL
jgi:hypothetical protein